MSSDVMKMRVGTAQRYRTENGVEYLRIDNLGMRLTLVARPDEEPAPGSEMGYSVIISRSPKGGHKPRPRVSPLTDRQPPAVPPDTPDRVVVADAEAERIVSRPATKAQREERAVDDILFRYGAIPKGGDPVPALGDTGDDPFALDRSLCEIEDEA